jgi:hypothetical protein
MFLLLPSSHDLGIIICERHIYKSLQVNVGVTTLALGLQLKQGLARVRTKREARQSRFMLPGV